jgi:hypothetical protein
MMMMMMKIIAIRTEIHKKTHKYTVWAEHWILFNVKPGGIAGLHPQSPTSFCMTTFSASLINLTTLLPQSRDISIYASRQKLKPRTPMIAQTRRSTRTRLHAPPPTSDISLGSLTLPAPEAGDFVKLILQYIKQALGFKGLLQSRWRKITNTLTHNLNNIN